MPYTLYHHPACPFCRKVRLVLGEKNLDCRYVIEEPWKRRPELLKMTPAGDIPVLEEPDGHIVSNHRAICEYLNEITTSLYGKYDRDRAESRRLCEWFDDKFNAEVTVYLAGEKIWRRLKGEDGPDSGIIRAGKANLSAHLSYVEWLLKRRRWLAGEAFSMADIAAAAHFSVLDYIGEIPWDEKENGKPVLEETKKWYARIKSHPSFQPLLKDRIEGVIPSRRYADLDF